MICAALVHLASYILLHIIISKVHIITVRLQITGIKKKKTNTYLSIQYYDDLVNAFQVMNFIHIFYLK